MCLEFIVVGLVARQFIGQEQGGGEQASEPRHYRAYRAVTCHALIGPEHGNSIVSIVSIWPHKHKYRASESTSPVITSVFMAKDPPSPTALLEAQLVVAKAATSKKQQKKDKAKSSKKASTPVKSKTASKAKQDKENRDVEPKADKGNGKTIHIS